MYQTLKIRINAFEHSKCCFIYIQLVKLHHLINKMNKKVVKVIEKNK